MDKILPENPVLILLYGFPGAGKTYFSRQFCDMVQAAHLEQDRIRYELFEQPRFTKQENFALNRIMEYMTSEFLNAGISVVYDLNAMRLGQRRTLRETARRLKASTLIVWFQVDPDTAYLRNIKRDRRKNDDRYAVGYDVEQFKQLAAYMQHPEPTEDFIVISGKHTFASQVSGVMKKLADMKVIKRSTAAGKMVRPDLVNLVPTPPTHMNDPDPAPDPDLPAPGQRPSRRNIVLR
jgi:predicted kinase